MRSKETEGWVKESIPRRTRKNVMDPEQAQESSERDQLWASLRTLRPEIDRLAAGQLDFSDRQKQIISVLARIVVAEMDYRAKVTSPE
jgi:hypothetical protein